MPRLTRIATGENSIVPRRGSNGFCRDPLGFRQKTNEFRRDPLGFRQKMNGFRRDPLGFRQKMNGFCRDPLGFRQKTNGFWQIPNILQLPIHEAARRVDGARWIGPGLS
jgi:hypothetical protein